MLLIVAGLAAGVALAVPSTPATDGTLSVKRGEGTFLIDVRGVVIGRMLRAEKLYVSIPISRSCDDLKVWGADDDSDGPILELTAGEPTWLCEFSSDSRIRFRLSGQLGVEIWHAKRLFLSVAGRGEAFIEGDGGQDGVISVNGGKERSVPDKPRTFVLEPDSSALRLPAHAD